MTRAVAAPMAWFGKLPARGDFVRSPNQPLLTRTLDHWLTQGLELMAEDPRWKEVYDQAVPTHFAFVGVRNRAVLAGHLIASTDGSGRRFPFATAATFEVGGPANHAGAPLAFMARSPMVLTRLWARFERAARTAVAATNDAAALGELPRTQVEVEALPQAYDAAFDDFLELQTVGSLEAMLRQAGHAVSVRRTLLALGLLLQPVPSSGQNALDRGLCLPLPADALYLPFVATFWIDRVARFLTRGDFEVVLFVPQGRPGDTAAPPRLRIGFSGGSAAVLHAALDPEAGQKTFVDMTQADWVEAQIGGDAGIRKLASYLEQPELSLRQARSTFGEAFLGD